MPKTELNLEDRAIYEEAIRRRVCSRCIDLGADGRCHGLDPEGCAVFRFLPELVVIAGRMSSPKIEPYVREVRQNVCMQCRSRAVGSECPLRDTLDCGLDRYLALVLEAVEEAEIRTAA